MYKEEASIGRLLAGYGKLEFLLGRCLSVVTGALAPPGASDSEAEGRNIEFLPPTRFSDRTMRSTTLLKSGSASRAVYLGARERLTSSLIAIG
jgi:hypothetical protein